MGSWGRCIEPALSQPAVLQLEFWLMIILTFHPRSKRSQFPEGVQMCRVTPQAGVGGGAAGRAGGPQGTEVSWSSTSIALLLRCISIKLVLHLFTVSDSAYSKSKPDQVKNSCLNRYSRTSGNQNVDDLSNETFCVARRRRWRAKTTTPLRASRRRSTASAPPPGRPPPDSRVRLRGCGGARAQKYG